VVLDGNGATVSRILRFKRGENRIISSTRMGDEAYFGLGLDTNSNMCLVVKVNLLFFAEVDAIAIQGCGADLISASISNTGAIAYFGTSASPANVYAVKLYETIGCVENCNGHGQCVQNACQCQGGWSGIACSAPPTCPHNCSRGGNCVLGVCHCNVGRSGIDCSIRDCRSSCVHGTCSGSNHTQWPCVCDATWNGERCDEQIVPCADDCSHHGTCVEGGCICEIGFTGDNCADVSCTESSQCSDEETCDTGICKASQSEPMNISPILIGVAVAAAAILGVVAGIYVWKSWASKATMPDISADNISSNLMPKKLFGSGDLEEGPSRVGVGVGNGYARIPRRLVK